jgi:glycine/D-amino acid oxidase-like deaminating enzyme
MNNSSTDILCEADLVVVGGGSAGPLAAIAAARQGADVLLVEAQGALGGSRTVMGVDTFYGFFSPGENPCRLVGGISYEVVERLLKNQAAFSRPNTFGAGTGITYDMEQLKIVFEEMALEAGVKLLYHTFVPDVNFENERISDLYTANKAGLKKVRTRMVIDATGDADIAALAGAPFELAGVEGRPVQSLSTIFFIGNVDNERAFGYPQSMRTKIMDEAAASGKYNLTRVGGSIHPTPYPGFVHANLTRIPNVNATDPFALTQAEIEGRRQVQEYLRFLKNEMPGFEDAFLAMTASHVGVRETRRIIGEYLLTAEDVIEGRQFEDAIACCAAPIEDHHSGIDVRWQYVQGNGFYQIPYRSLLPRSVQNLLVAGRCLSATHEAQASARNSAQCMAMGEAAGLAAALALTSDIEPRELSAQKLRENLIQQGVILEPEPVSPQEILDVRN